MVEMIRDRESSEKVERHDLFSSLLEANKGESGIAALTDDEVIGK